MRRHCHDLAVPALPFYLEEPDDPPLVVAKEAERIVRRWRAHPALYRVPGPRPDLLIDWNGSAGLCWRCDGLTGPEDCLVLWAESNGGWGLSLWVDGVCSEFRDGGALAEFAARRTRLRAVGPPTKTHPIFTDSRYVGWYRADACWPWEYSYDADTLER